MGTATRHTYQDPYLFTLTLKPVHTAVKAARDLVAFAWRHWGLGDDTDARLVASELATNAVRASREDQRIEVRCFLDGQGMPTLEVADRSAEPIVMKDTNRMDTEGRGLFIVAQLVTSWEVLPLPGGGKVIRVRLPLG